MRGKITKKLRRLSEQLTVGKLKKVHKYIKTKS